jgi:hypothetical protein
MQRTNWTMDERKSSSSSSARPQAFGFLGIDVDVIERLPAPYGLVRYGVTPDHPDIMNVKQEIALLFDAYLPDDDSDDAITTLSYFGNVNVGRCCSPCCDRRMMLSYLRTAHSLPTDGRRYPGAAMVNWMAC